MQKARWSSARAPVMPRQRLRPALRSKLELSGALSRLRAALRADVALATLEPGALPAHEAEPADETLLANEVVREARPSASSEAAFPPTLACLHLSRRSRRALALSLTRTVATVPRVPPPLFQPVRLRGGDVVDGRVGARPARIG